MDNGRMENGQWTMGNGQWGMDNGQEKGQGYDLTPFTTEEIDAMLDEAEAALEAGKGIPHEQVMREMDEEIERWEQEERIMAKAI